MLRASPKCPSSFVLVQPELESQKETVIMSTDEFIRMALASVATFE